MTDNDEPQVSWMDVHAHVPVIASGGVSSLADLQAIAGLRALGVEGAIVGKALYAGAFTLPEALAAVAR